MGGGGGGLFSRPRDTAFLPSVNRDVLKKRSVNRD